MVDFEIEATKLTNLLHGKVVKVIRRYRAEEVLIEFEGGTRLFVNGISHGLEFSVTG